MSYLLKNAYITTIEPPACGESPLVIENGYLDAETRKMPLDKFCVRNLRTRQKIVTNEFLGTVAVAQW